MGYLDLTSLHRFGTLQTGEGDSIALAFENLKSDPTNILQHPAMPAPAVLTAQTCCGCACEYRQPRKEMFGTFTTRQLLDVGLTCWRRWCFDGFPLVSKHLWARELSVVKVGMIFGGAPMAKVICCLRCHHSLSPRQTLTCPPTLSRMGFKKKNKISQHPSTFYTIAIYLPNPSPTHCKPYPSHTGCGATCCATCGATGVGGATSGAELISEVIASGPEVTGVKALMEAGVCGSAFTSEGKSYSSFWGGSFQGVIIEVCRFLLGVIVLGAKKGSSCYGSLDHMGCFL